LKKTIIKEHAKLFIFHKICNEKYIQPKKWWIQIVILITDKFLVVLYINLDFYSLDKYLNCNLGDL
jgi:hypothetical protein